MGGNFSVDSRFFYILGDVLSCALTGAVVALVSYALIGLSWPVVVAMVVMMVLGMLIGLLLFFPLSISFGAMEIMIPCMLAGMVSGMVVGMWLAMQPLTLLGAVTIGVETALCVLLFVWVANTLLRGTRTIR